MTKFGNHGADLKQRPRKQKGREIRGPSHPLGSGGLLTLPERFQQLFQRAGCGPEGLKRPFQS